MKRIVHLGELQLKIMRVLWARGEATVNEARAAVGSRLAPATIATLLRRLEAQGLVRHRVEGRTFVYTPLIAEDAVARGLVGELLNRLFVGSVPALVNHLLRSRDLSAEELAEMEKMITERKRKS
jgi:predicted transcriptional regulator